MQENIVDISVAGFGWNYDRNEIVDFTPGIFKSKMAVLIRRPTNHDPSFRYFLLGMVVVI